MLFNIQKITFIIACIGFSCWKFEFILEPSYKFQLERRTTAFTSISLYTMWTQAFKLGVPMNKLDDGDKLLLPASALESLLSQSSANTSEFGSRTNAFGSMTNTSFGNGPEINQTSGLPSPITFEIRNVKARNLIYGGVKEFSAEDGLVHMPRWMQRSLNLETGDTVALRLKELPKGQWARLRPISADYKEIVDYRAALESYLRANYNTLTAGEILNIKYGSNRYEFLVDDLKPEKAVCVTDTDIEIDIEPLEQGTTLAHEQNAQTTSILASSQATDQPLNLGQSIDGHAATDQYVYFHVKLDGVNSDLELVLLTKQGGDTGK
jgi:Ubiquitin fusion degradation protein UFD1